MASCQAANLGGGAQPAGRHGVEDACQAHLATHRGVPLGRGSALTEALAIRHDRPLLPIDFDHTPVARAVVVVERWLHAHRIATLNVAGPRASSEPRIHAAVFALLTAVDWSSLAAALHKHLLEEQA